LLFLAELLPDRPDGGVGVVGDELVEVTGDGVHYGAAVGLSLPEPGGGDLAGQRFDDRRARYCELFAEPLDLLVAFGGTTYAWRLTSAIV
jgi:hypothetical protein